MEKYVKEILYGVIWLVGMQKTWKIMNEKCKLSEWKQVLLLYVTHCPNFYQQSQ
jgi:hypothetical protein